MINPHLPLEAEVVERIQESPTIFTLRLRLTDPVKHAAFRFAPGQFNMIYLYGVGEVPISIVSDPQDEHLFDHAIRVVGRVTRGLEQLKAGEFELPPGCEVTYDLAKHFRAGLGFNFTDISDNEFSKNDYSVRGWFVRLQGRY